MYIYVCSIVRICYLITYVYYVRICMPSNMFSNIVYVMYIMYEDKTIYNS